MSLAPGPYGPSVGRWRTESLSASDSSETEDVGGQPRKRRNVIWVRPGRGRRARRGALRQYLLAAGRALPATARNDWIVQCIARYLPAETTVPATPRGWALTAPEQPHPCDPGRTPALRSSRGFPAQNCMLYRHNGTLWAIPDRAPGDGESSDDDDSVVGTEVAGSAHPEGSVVATTDGGAVLCVTHLGVSVLFPTRPGTSGPTRLAGADIDAAMECAFTATVGPPGPHARVLVFYDTGSRMGCVDTGSGNEVAPPEAIPSYMTAAHTWPRAAGGIWVALLPEFCSALCLDVYLYVLQPPGPLRKVCDIEVPIPVLTPRWDAVRAVQGSGHAWLVLHDMSDSDSVLVGCISLLGHGRLVAWTKTPAPPGWQTCTIVDIVAGTKPILEFV